MKREQLRLIPESKLDCALLIAAVRAQLAEWGAGSKRRYAWESLQVSDDSADGVWRIYLAEYTNGARKPTHVWPAAVWVEAHGDSDAHPRVWWEWGTQSNYLPHLPVMDIPEEDL